MPKTETTNPTTEIAILGRLLSNGSEGFTPALAQYLLSLGFNDDDKARMHELATRNQQGVLSPVERKELFAYSNSGCLLGILQSKARKALKNARKYRVL